MSATRPGLLRIEPPFKILKNKKAFHGYLFSLIMYGICGAFLVCDYQMLVHDIFL